MIRTLITMAASRLGVVSDSARLDAELLLAHVLDISRSQLSIRDHLPVEERAATAFHDLVERRAHGVPVAYLLGYRDFWSHRFLVGPGVLVPRPDTELLVEWALDALKDRREPRILDLGAGSGAIGISLACERPDATVDLVERSPAARPFTARNIAALAPAQCTLYDSDWFSALGGQRYDLIISNPPYVAPGDPHLPSLRHEPAEALVADGDGLADLRTISQQAPAHLCRNGVLLLEHGYDQAAAVRHLLGLAGFGQISTRRDLSGTERATGGIRPD